MKITIGQKMKYTRHLDKIPAGFSLSDTKPGERVTVQTREFVSSEDGDHFINRLEIVNEFLNTPLGVIQPSQVDSLLVIIHPNQNAEVYINQANVIGLALSKKAKEAGEAIYSDDIARISKIEFKDCEIKNTDGVLYLFSRGWRKALFYDFACVIKDMKPRDYDIYKALGIYYEYILFNERFKLLKSVWDELFSSNLFPFILLPENLIKKMVHMVKTQVDLEPLFIEIRKLLISEEKSIMDSFTGKKFYNDQLEFIRIAYKHLNQSDYISCIAVLYPRIEGILRQLFFSIHPSSTTAKQEDQVSAITEKYDSNFGILFPGRFKKYITQCYFRNFNPHDPEGLSRNTVGHGVAKLEEFNLQGAILGFLILIQIKYYLSE